MGRVDGANRHDVKLLSATLDGLVISRPESTGEQPQHLCLDAAYDSTPVYGELVSRHYQPHVRSRGEEKREKEIIPGYRARRWVVERSHSWINRSRRLLVRSREEGRKLSRLSSFGLCSTYLHQGHGFRISF